jgi:hypothetical protein
MDISEIDSEKIIAIKEQNFENLLKLTSTEFEGKGWYLIDKPEIYQNIVDASMEVFRNIKGYNENHSAVLLFMDDAILFCREKDIIDFEYNFAQYFEEIHQKFCKGRVSDYVGTDWLTFNDYVGFLTIIKYFNDVKYYKFILKFILEKSKDTWGVEDGGLSRIMDYYQLTKSQAEDILNDAKQRCDKSDFREINKRYKERNSEENDYDYFHSDENWDSFAPFDR